MSAFQPINTRILETMADSRAERMNVKGMVCSFACHALVLGILFYGAVGRGTPLPPPVEDGILSMHVVDAGSGGMHVGPEPGLSDSPGTPFEPLPQQAAPKQPREEALPEPQPEPVPLPLPDMETIVANMKKKVEPKPSEPEIRHPKQEPRKSAPQKAPPRQPQPRVAKASIPAKTHGASTAVQGKTASKGAGLGQGAGSGTFASRNSGSGDGQARRTTLSFLMAQLERYKKYPTPARRLGLEGVVNVLVSIDGNGALRDLRRADEKAHPILQKATDQMLAKVRANWKNQAAGQEISIVIPIRYTLRDG